jgi:hypothetical protein
MFGNMLDLQNHVKRWCLGQKSLKREHSDDEVVPGKKG